MKDLYLKVIVILMLFVGEALSIYAEMVGARTHSIASKPFLEVFPKMFLIFAIAGGFLITGYMLGYVSFKNIWVVSVVSVTSILIMEPVLAYAVFNQLPTNGAIIGLVFGVLGFMATMLL